MREAILFILSEIGLLSRGTEKLMEFNKYNANIPYFTRLDYVSPICQEELFMNAVERSYYYSISKYTSNCRTLFLEVSRILNHLLAITTHGIDIGALNPMLWAFEEREQLLNFQEAISGARIHTTFMIRLDLPFNFPWQVYDWSIHFPTKLKEIHKVLTNNRVWIDRLHEIGIIDRSRCLISGYSGVLSRASGTANDGRLTAYESYKTSCFHIILGSKGDCLDRYLIRINECFESSQLILTYLHRLPYLSPISLFSGRSGIIESIESLIRNFNLIYESDFSLSVRIFHECPKGLYSIFVIPSLVLEIPSRIDFTPNDFLTVTTLNRYCRNIPLADLIAILGSIDFVLGSIDAFSFYSEIVQFVEDDLIHLFYLWDNPLSSLFLFNLFNVRGWDSYYFAHILKDPFIECVILSRVESRFLLWIMWSRSLWDANHRFLPSETTSRIFHKSSLNIWFSAFLLSIDLWIWVFILLSL